MLTMAFQAGLFFACRPGQFDAPAGAVAVDPGVKLVCLVSDYPLAGCLGIAFSNELSPPASPDGAPMQSAG